MMLWNRYAAMRRMGVLGLNARNGDYIMRYNRRELYPRVDNKVTTKQLLMDAGMPVPRLYGVVATQHHAARLDKILYNRKTFALKPANGSGGDGILVITGHRNKQYQKADGRYVSEDFIEHQVSNILNGMYSLGGLPDQAMIEALVVFDPVFDKIAFQGVPDIRVIVFLGYPVMAMVRLPTRMSDGKANLHQGAVGAGIRLATGTTRPGVWGNHVIDEHPDTGERISGFEIPYWDRILHMASSCYEAIGLGYIGCDIVLDQNAGPLILELNARPGLNIQLANQTGLLHRLRWVESVATEDRPPEERIAMAVEQFGKDGKAVV